jgi:hypothetical protein
MTIGMWFTDDLANILRSLTLSSFVPGIPQDERYQAGFQSALLLVAVALGIPAAQARELVAVSR